MDPIGGDHYRTLGVASDATYEQIRAAYRQLARVHHPDASGAAAHTDTRMMAVNAAWRVLSDPDRRAAYNRGRAGATGSSGVKQGHGSQGGGRQGTPEGANEFTHSDDEDDDLAWVIPEVDSVAGRRWMLLITATLVIAAVLIIALFVYAFARSGAVVR